MRRPALTALLITCAVALGIAVSIERTAISAEPGDQASRPRRLSKVPPVERFGQAALDAQAAFLQRMPSAQIRYGDNGAVAEIKGRTGLFVRSGLSGFQVNKPAPELLETIGPALLAAGTEELRPFRINSKAPRLKPDSPERMVKFVQYIRGREVQQSSLNVTLNIHTKEITHIVADFLPDRGLQHEPKLTAAEARAKVEAAMRQSGLEEGKKIFFEDSPAHLAYAFEDISDTGGIGGVLVWVFKGTRDGESTEVVVSALTGEVIRLRSFVTGLHFPLRLSYTANYAAPPSVGFPNGLTFTFGEGGTPPDQVAANLYNTAGIVFGAYDQVFGRNSWNDAGAAMKLVTHYNTNQFTAGWAPLGYIMVAENAPSRASDIDAIAHEFAHGIREAEGGLILNNGPPDGAAALDEAFGDWGATVADVKLNLGLVSPSTWQISNLRNLQAPTLGDPFARDWFPTRSNIIGTGTAHRNSTIMGHALYLLAMGGQHYRAGLPGSEVPVIPVTGVSYPAARDIFYDAVSNGALTSNATFFSMRNATFNAAPPALQTSVQQAWDAVGVGYNCTSAPQTPQVVVWPGYCQGRHRLEWSAVPGATIYDGQVTRQELGWAFAATVVDANVTSCRQNVPPGFWLFRLRACNGCGCSAWSTERYMEYWSGPCA